MPTNLNAAAVLILAVLPGLIGERIYHTVVGIHWREAAWRSVLRLVAFSTAGATIYSLVATWLNLPPPIHLMPGAYQEAATDVSVLNQIFPPYAGHVIGGTVAGLIAAWSVILLAKLSPRSVFPSAWDDFVRTYVADRWVIVGLQNYEIYAGRLLNADISVPTGERDLILAEPCLFVAEAKNYRALNYQYLFIPASSLFSIAGVAEPTDPRLVKAGQFLFEETESDASQEATTATTTSTTCGAAAGTRMAPIAADSKASRTSATTATNTKEEIGSDCSRNLPASKPDV